MDEKIFFHAAGKNKNSKTIDEMGAISTPLPLSWSNFKTGHYMLLQKRDHAKSHIISL